MLLEKAHRELHPGKLYHGKGDGADCPVVKLAVGSLIMYWGYENCTSPDLEWWKSVQMPNGWVFDCHLNSEHPNY